MPIFNDYDASGNLLETRNEPISAKNAARFVKEYGVEKARIYFEVLDEFKNEINGIIFPFKNQVQVEETPHFVKKGTEKLFYSKVGLLNEVKPILFSEDKDAHGATFPAGAEKFDHLFKAQGKEMAQLRFDTMKGFNDEIYWIINQLKGPHHIENNPYTVKRKIHVWYKEKVDALEAARPLLAGSNNDSPQGIQP